MKVLVTGGTGLLGSALRNVSNTYELDGNSFMFIGSKDVDLCCYDKVLEFLTRHRPDAIIHLAANVGGLFKNLNNKVDMFEANLLMNTYLLRASHQVGIDIIVSCLSTCIFPDKATYPITEDQLHLGTPHPSNDGYAYAKRMLEVQSRMYREQYGRRYICIIPPNIYGEYDNFDLQNGHVIPTLIHKCYLAKLSGKSFVVAGTGKPLRQFIYSQDLAKLILKVLFEYNDVEPLILSPPEDSHISIAGIAKLIAKEFDYEDNLVFDTSLPDGQYRKSVSNKKMIQVLGEVDFIPIEEGIKKTITWFIENYDTLRK